MGVKDMLKICLGSAGRPVDLRDFADGIRIVDNHVDQRFLLDNSGSSSPSRQPQRQRRPKRQRFPDEQRRRRPLMIGIDVSLWIHNAAFAFGDQLGDERHLTNYGRAQLTEEQQEEATASATTTITPAPSDQVVQNYISSCVRYVVKRLQIVRDTSGARILVVLDGLTPPIKGTEKAKRRAQREQHQRERDEPVMNLLGNDGGDGDNNDDNDRLAAIEAHNKRRTKSYKRAGAGPYYPLIQKALLEALRHEEIPFLVAPYEADGQLAAMSRMNYLDLVLTEDSDLIAHGAWSVLYKTHDGLAQGKPTGILFQFTDIGAAHETSRFDFMDFSPVHLAVLFVLLGCDYYDKKLEGIGPKTAHDIVREAFLEPKASRRRGKQAKSRSALETVWAISYERCYLDSTALTDAFKREYERGFIEALFMYRHPIYYDPLFGDCRWANTRMKSGDNGELLHYEWRNLYPIGDPELLDCQEYADLCRDKKRIESITGQQFSTKISCDCAEGRHNWPGSKSTTSLSDSSEPQTVFTEAMAITQTAEEAEDFVSGQNVDQKEQDLEQEPEPRRIDNETPAKSSSCHTKRPLEKSPSANQASANRKGKKARVGRGFQDSISSSDDDFFPSRKLDITPSKKQGSNDSKKIYEKAMDEDDDMNIGSDDSPYRILKRPQGATTPSLRAKLLAAAANISCKKGVLNDDNDDSSDDDDFALPFAHGPTPGLQAKLLAPAAETSFKEGFLNHDNDSSDDYDFTLPAPRVRRHSTPTKILDRSTPRSTNGKRVGDLEDSSSDEDYFAAVVDDIEENSSATVPTKTSPRKSGKRTGGTSRSSKKCPAGISQREVEASPKSVSRERRSPHTRASTKSATTARRQVAGKTSQNARRTRSAERKSSSQSSQNMEAPKPFVKPWRPRRKKPKHLRIQQQKDGREQHISPRRKLARPNYLETQEDEEKQETNKSVAESEVDPKKIRKIGTKSQKTPIVTDRTVQMDQEFRREYLASATTPSSSRFFGKTGVNGKETESDSPFWSTATQQPRNLFGSLNEGKEEVEEDGNEEQDDESPNLLERSTSEPSSQSQAASRTLQEEGDGEEEDANTGVLDPAKFKIPTFDEILAAQGPIDSDNSRDYEI